MDMIFALPGNEELTLKLAQKRGVEVGKATIRHFPDDETYVKIDSDVTDKNVAIVCTLDRPDTKILPLLFMAKTIKQLGAKEVLLVAPYLAYMRQDRRFTPGEAVTSELFAGIISHLADEMVTIDPHLHRRSNLAEIYTIPTATAHAARYIAEWVRDNISDPLLIGPDSESEQWVSEVSNSVGAPYLILEKVRHSDTNVDVSLPNIEQYRNHIPVLIDDIISTGRTMIETVKHLKEWHTKPPICIGVHAVFAGDAYDALLEAGAEKVVTCNTIPHPSNAIDLTDLLLESMFS